MQKNIILDEQQNAIKITDPWTLDIGITPNPELVKFTQKKNDISEPEILQLSNIDNLKQILEDVMSGDAKAQTRPEFTCLNIDSVIKQISWLTSTDQISDTMRYNLAVNPYLLQFKQKPPTMEEFLSEYYIGDMAQSLRKPLKDVLIEFWEPLKPYRTLGLLEHIGWGKEQPLTSKIYESPKKWFYMGDQQVGMKVLTPNGTQQKIQQVFPQGVKPVFKIKLSNGRVARQGLNHLWHVSYRKDLLGNKIWENVTTKFMLEHKTYKFEIPVK